MFYLPANHGQTHFGVRKQFYSVPLAIDGSHCFQLLVSIAIDALAKGEETVLATGRTAVLSGRF